MLVIGSGHAGIEAALASARLGCHTLMVTQNLDTIGQMSCNPAIGGSAKSHLVKEVDALGGAMGANADATGIQFRTLNRSKGPAVWATRVQCDKKAYQFRLKAVLERTPNLALLQGTAHSLLTENGVVRGARTDLGIDIAADAVVVTAGTFLRGLLHVGEQAKPGGRMGEAASGLSQNIRDLGFEAGRFKTGTPSRLKASSIDWSLLEVQGGETPAPRLSFLHTIPRAANDFFTLNFDANGVFHVEQLPCWITRTTAATHDLIRSNLHRSPLYQRRIEGAGPRYCPSIEDKIVRFSGKESHPVFLEPEGRHSDEIYVNGISTSLPFDVQIALVRSIPGLEHAEIMRPGYAVEYDYFPPTQLRPTLETQKVARLFFAGQVNGTSGYEEAAAQGLVAGTNAALAVRGQEALVLPPEESYIGVMVEDLTTRGTDEPYRMFTSRAANRLSLREDNADLRLTPIGMRHGLVDPAREFLFCEKQKAISSLALVLRQLRVNGRLVSEAMKDPGFHWLDLPAEVQRLSEPHIWHHIATEVKYSGYIARAQARQLPKNSTQLIPDGIDFWSIPGLRTETRQKLGRARPTSIQIAGRVSGVTEADLMILETYITRLSSR